MDIYLKLDYIILSFKIQFNKVVRAGSHVLTGALF